MVGLLAPAEEAAEEASARRAGGRGRARAAGLGLGLVVVRDRGLAEAGALAAGDLRVGSGLNHGGPVSRDPAKLEII